MRVAARAAGLRVRESTQVQAPAGLVWNRSNWERWLLSEENMKQESCSRVAGFVPSRSVDGQVPEARHVHAAPGRRRTREYAYEGSGRLGAWLASLAPKRVTWRQGFSFAGELSICRCAEV